MIKKIFWGFKIHLPSFYNQNKTKRKKTLFLRLLLETDGHLNLDVPAPRMSSLLQGKESTTRLF